MSVDVKTPTKTQFEHAEFPCGDKKGVPTVIVTGSVEPSARPAFHRQASDTLGNRFPRKRRFSERAGGTEGGNRERYFGAPGSKRNRFCRGGNRGNFSVQKSVLPTRFLLGGNINDPLNLGSLSDEAVNKALNENTPKSSPLAVPIHRQEVHVLIPPNRTDPLWLNPDGLPPMSPNGKTQGKKKRKKHKKKYQGDKSDIARSTTGDVGGSSVSTDPSKDFSKPISIDIASDSEMCAQQPLSSDLVVEGTVSDTPLTPVGPGSHNSSANTLNKTVSPVVPQPIMMISPKGRSWRKRTSSECRSDQGSQRASVDSDKSVKSDKSLLHRPKYKRQHSHCSSTQSQPTTPPVGFTNKPKPRGRKHNKQFIYGNYNRYYGYRNPDRSEKDDRLKNFKRVWFEGKDVLDIGCNVGHVTLEIAKELCPRKVVGMDIDPLLISAAKRNVRHYLTTRVTDTKKYPSSMLANFGPIAAPPVMDKEDPIMLFPNNVMFLTGNYVLESDELVDMTQEEYDVILALSITKWVHLNWGDAGLKRMFRRMFKQLRPGGKLILEPQLWPSYKKRKKLTEAHSMNYAAIQLRPEQFREFLLRDVGFSTCEGLEVPFNKAKGFQRPLHVFTKSDTTNPGSRVTTPGRFSDTCSRGATPRFHVGGWSGTTSPGTCDSPSNSATPGYSDSPKRLLPSKAELIHRDASFLTSTPIEEHVATSHRALGDVQSRSAPSLLETPPHCGEQKAASTPPALQTLTGSVIKDDEAVSMGVCEQTSASQQNAKETDVG